MEKELLHPCSKDFKNGNYCYCATVKSIMLSVAITSIMARVMFLKYRHGWFKAVSQMRKLQVITWQELASFSKLFC
jgi:ribonuclease HIII